MMINNLSNIACCIQRALIKSAPKTLKYETVTHIVARPAVFHANAHERQITVTDADHDTQGILEKHPD